MKNNILPPGIGFSDTQRYRKTEITNTVREMLIWGRERIEEGEKVYLLANSGVTHPDIWNPLQRDIFRNLSMGMRFTHCTGPIVCTDNNGRNCVISAYLEFPEVVGIELNRTYNLYHWILIGVEGEKTFKLLGEGYHRPLSTKRYCYQTNSDQSIELYLSKLYEYDVLKSIRDKPSSVYEIPKLTKPELGVVLEKIKNMRSAETYITERIEDGQKIEIMTSSPISKESRLFVSEVEFNLLNAKDIKEILFSTDFFYEKIQKIQGPKTI